MNWLLQQHHGGYKLPWIGGEQPGFHDFHHEKFVGASWGSCVGSITLWLPCGDGRSLPTACCFIVR